MPKGSRREGASLPIYTSLNFPTVTTYPSLKCLQWSADGQLCFTTKNAAYILTPDHGINFDNNSVVKSTPNKDDPALGWFKTMIQSDKVPRMKWPDYSQAWGAVSLGSIDLALSAVIISPSGLSPHGGCIFVTLSSNMDMHLWTAAKNYLKGEWVKIFELTPYLLNIIAPADEAKCNVAAVLQAQIVSMEWTAQIDFGMSPTPCLNGSLLILGSRAGYLTFLRYRNIGSPEYIGTLPVADKWITQIAFSCWNIITLGSYEGYLAYGTSDGSVGLVKITQTLHSVEDTFSFVPTYSVISTLEHGSSLIYGPEGNAGITSLKWIHIPGRTAILVSSNPGLIKLWSVSDHPEATYWTGYRSLRIQTQKISTDSSAFHPVSGITYLQMHDALIVTLFDGSFHVISDFAQDPKWASRSMVEGGKYHLTSETLSGVSRSMFEKVEKGDVDRNDMVRINGAVAYDDAATFLWVYESSRPSDFSYKHDAKHSSMLVVAQMWDHEDHTALLESLATLLNTVKTCSAQSPLQMLRPFLLHLRNPARLDALHAQFLEILRPQLQDDHSKKVVLLSWDGDEANEELRLQFRVGLVTNLFGWDDLLSLRMRLSLADFAWKLASNEQHQMECGVVAQSLLNAISHRVLRTIIRHLVAVVKSITATELPFVSRMVVQSMLTGSPADLSAEGQHLSVLIRPLMETEPDSSGEVPSENILSMLNEICPACGVEVPLEDITTARCKNGHAWARCSVTTFILSTPWVRTCVGCSRKAFLPPSAKKELPVIARGWVAEELLEAVQRCLFCNNAFVGIL